LADKLEKVIRLSGGFLLSGYNIVVLDEACVFEGPTELSERLHQLLFLLAKHVVFVWGFGKTVLGSSFSRCTLFALHFK
jgi:hypothetical protein